MAVEKAHIDGMKFFLVHGLPIDEHLVFKSHYNIIPRSLWPDLSNKYEGLEEIIDILKI